MRMQAGHFPTHSVSSKWLSVLDFLENYILHMIYDEKGKKLKGNRHELVEEPDSKRSRLSSEPTSFQLADLHQAEVETKRPSDGTRLCLGKEVMVKGEPSHRMTTANPASFSIVECKDIEVSEESMHQDLE
ncbi:hypothetical protein FNV43_RR07346 [Rhamnella rubrinervis]|uniref:Uncharacterized protein n=1 Tax=Rhamnella rubrinervis TaxID=2594499 RepID=A0A8K0MM39_9ROSA|nr:hypothetical protein FNV43_RR07346 [Rhamnella rubrinervis]